MKPTRSSQATLVDLLDRVLDKGLVLDADIIIHVAGIPLLGVKLRAALAGMETMLKYGIWQDWDIAQRKAASEEYRYKEAIKPHNIVKPVYGLSRQSVILNTGG